MKDIIKKLVLSVSLIMVWSVGIYLLCHKWYWFYEITLELIRIKGYFGVLIMFSYRIISLCLAISAFLDLCKLIKKSSKSRLDYNNS